MKGINEYSKGKAEIRPASWKALLNILSDADSKHWIFRGAASTDWKLKTSLERALASPQASGAALSGREAEIAAVHFFKVHAGHHLPERPADDDLLGWQFIMQHDGAPTRILDWTRSPFVALFFAYADPALTAGRTGALWMLNAFEVQVRYHESFSSSLPFKPHSKDGVVSVVLNPSWYKEQSLIYEYASSQGMRWPLVVMPKQLDSRMVAQQAAFTIDGSLKVDQYPQPTKELWPLPPCRIGAKTRELSAGSGSVPSHASEVVRRIILDGAWREDALRALARMNITAATLFPGIDGVGRATTLHVASGQRIYPPVQDTTITLKCAFEINSAATIKAQ
jgi:hypothetical protein